MSVPAVKVKDLHELKSLFTHVETTSRPFEQPSLAPATITIAPPDTTPASRPLSPLDAAEAEKGKVLLRHGIEPFYLDKPLDWMLTGDDLAYANTREASYRCPHCGTEYERYAQSPRDLPALVVCGCVQVADNPAWATAPVGSALPRKIKKFGLAFRRYSFPGERIALNAQRFEPMVIYQSLSDPNKFSFPGRNNEPTDQGYRRIEITNIQEANHWTRKIERVYNSQMSDHREMHRYYWNARRKALRAHVDAQTTKMVDAPLWNHIIRPRSDAKTEKRYGKSLNSNFHLQLIEFNQSNMQAYCDADTGWHDRRAK